MKASGLFFLLITAVALAAPAAHRPNIILMMADDDIAPHGGDIHTPNPAALASSLSRARIP